MSAYSELSTCFHFHLWMWKRSGYLSIDFCVVESADSLGYLLLITASQKRVFINVNKSKRGSEHTFASVVDYISAPPFVLW